MKAAYQSFLTQELPNKLKSLSPTQAPNFGLMTAHHMAEHLVFVTKSMMKRRGEPEGELNKSQQFFRNFLDKGCPFIYRPKEDAKLNDLRTQDMEEAVQLLLGATEKFYSLFKDQPDYKSYSPMTGEFNLAELELFFYQHGRWHLHQFGLIEEFEPVFLQAR